MWIGATIGSVVGALIGLLVAEYVESSKHATLPDTQERRRILLREEANQRAD